jgi:PST family polysaccharide transporter
VTSDLPGSGTTFDAPPAAAPAERGVSSSRAERTLVGGFWMTLGMAAQGALTVLVLALLARFLQPRDFGVVSTGLLIVNFSLIFAQVGVGPALVQHPRLRPEHGATGLMITGSLSVGATLLLWGLAPVIAGRLEAPEVTAVLRALACVLPIQGLSVVSEALLRRALRFRELALARVVAYTAGYGLVGTTAAVLGAGAWTLVAAHATQTVVNTALLLRAQPFGRRPRFERAAARELAVFGGGFSLARVGNYAAVYGDKMATVTWLGVTALGLYERAYQLMAMPAVAVGQVLDDVLFPAMAQVQHDRSRLALAYRRCVAGVALLTLPISMIAVVVAPELIAVLLGPRWAAVVLPFRILAVGMLFRASYKISDALARAVGVVYRRAWRQWVYAALVVAGVWGGHPWGLPGVAAGVLVALVTNFVLMAELSLAQVELTRAEFARAHMPGLRLAVVVGTTAWTTAALARGAEMPPPAVLALTAGAVLMLLAGLYRVAPLALLGGDGSWLTDKARQTIGTRLRRAPKPEAAPSVLT